MTCVLSRDELAEWSGGVWEPAGPDLIEGVSNDTRTIERGNLYFALAGDNFDGHKFVADAVRHGAVGSVVSRDWACASASGALLRVDDPAKALRDIATRYRAKVNPYVVAVTGSAGKTTVKEMAARMLAAVVPTASTRGNWNNNIGLPLSILAMASDARAGVFELGMNHPGEITELCDILAPTCGIVTNVGPVHLEFFDSVEAIAEEKAGVLRALPPGGVAVLNKDGGHFDLLSCATEARIITVSARGDADYVCSVQCSATGDALVRESATGADIPMNVRVPGLHNVLNATLAAAMARSYGVAWGDIINALACYRGLPMRWDETDIGGVAVINDAYNANPLSMRAAIKALGELPITGGRWLILAGMLEIGDTARAEHFALGEFVSDGDWAGLITVGELGELIARGAGESGFDRDRIFCCTDNAEASVVAADNTSAGDALLLKASRGMKLEQIVELWLASAGQPGMNEH